MLNFDVFEIPYQFSSPCPSCEAACKRKIDLESCTINISGILQLSQDCDVMVGSLDDEIDQHRQRNRSALVVRWQSDLIWLLNNFVGSRSHFSLFRALQSKVLIFFSRAHTYKRDPVFFIESLVILREILRFNIDFLSEKSFVFGNVVEIETHHESE